MKGMKLKRKKGMAKLLTAIMVAGLLPMMPSNMAMVHAAEPSSTAYATKEELMNWDYQNTVGKIVFGKDSSGNPMEWYILGSDSGVNGDNTAIFATSPIVTNVMFEDDCDNNKTYQESFGTYQNNTPTEVYPNHYGASDLRAELNKMLDDNTYFTEGEKSLLQATTVTTTDKMNSASYTTTDKLYALHGDYYNNDEILYAGSDNGKALVMSTYWNDSSADWFWLRLPFDWDDDVIVVNPGDRVYIINVDYDRAVQPASNLNLSSVIFASAAPAASSDAVEAGTIQTGKAMTLRMDGSNMNMGNVIYDSARPGMIFVKKSANATGTVSLVVQGNDGSNDWYYSKTVTAGEVIRMADIKTALNLSADISVDDCKIWLETTTGGMIYAKELVSGNYAEISEVALTMDAPVAESALDTQAQISQAGFTTSTPAIIWKAGTENAGVKADYATEYTAYVTLTVADTAILASDVTATVNGETADITINDNGKVEVSYTFPATKEKKEEDKPISNIQPKVGAEIKSADGKATYKVTKIAKNANAVTYKGPTNKNVKKVVIPATVTINNVTYKLTAIADGAFKNCKKLKNLTIGKNVVTIGNMAFYKCTALTKVTIPSKVKKIGSKAFYGCSKMKNLIIKSSKLSAKKIGSKAFAKTPKSMTVKVPKKKFKTYKKILIKRGVNKKAKFRKN